MSAAICQYRVGIKLMATPWDQFIDAIERRKTQLDELLEAYANFRKKLDALPPEVAQEAQMILASAEATKLREEAATKKDLIGKPALDCARIILTELNNEPTHFSTIAQMAMARGYKGRAEGSQAEVESRVQNSFWAALHRSQDFESAGKGCYHLKVGDLPDSGSSQAPDDDPEEMTQKEAAKRILQDLGRSAKVGEILHEALNRGWLKVASSERNLSNSIYGMMTRNETIFTKIGPGEFDLVDRR